MESKISTEKVSEERPESEFELDRTPVPPEPARLPLAGEGLELVRDSHC